MSDSDADAAWRAFVEGDTQIQTPSSVRFGVMAAWDDAQRGGLQVRAESRFPGAARTLAASVAAVVIGLALRVGVPWFDPAEPAAGVTATTEIGAPLGLVRLAADVTFESESLRVVRLRLPRTSLAAFGIALLEPDTSGLVDLDLLVGDDGLAREVLSARPVLDVASHQSASEQLESRP